jgi:uncharacterized cupredoxin-like copper-binding protein
MKQFIFALSTIALTSSFSAADTTQTGPSRYEIDAGVNISLGNFASSDYLFNWSDSSGSFTDIADPTLVLTAGETYVFLNLTSVHPFIITDDTLPVAGTDGEFFRTTSSGTVMDDATLQPIADFTSDPGGSDPLTWTPTNDDAGIYYYTCRVSGHLDMTGQIEIVAAAPTCQADLNDDGNLNFFDVSAFLAAFSAMNPDADFNNDGSFNFFDVSAFLSAFLAGCP